MSINCGNKSIIGPHTHDTKDEVRMCCSGEQVQVQATSSDIIDFGGSDTGWVARTNKVVVHSVTKSVNPVAGSMRIEFELRFAGSASTRPIFAHINVAGKNLKLVNKVYCLFAGGLLTDALGETQIENDRVFMAMKHAAEGQVITAWVREAEPNGQGNVFLVSSPTTWHIAS